MEVRTVLITLLSQFWFELDPEMGGEAEVRRNMIMSLTLKMKGGLRVRCTPHGQASTGPGAAAGTALAAGAAAGAAGAVGGKVGGKKSVAQAPAGPGTL